MSRTRLLAFAAVGTLAAWTLLLLSPASRPELQARAFPEVADPDAWVAAKVAAGEALGAWPQASERLVRHAEGRAPVAFLYVHGFGATRAEGEAVVDRLADEWGANALYLRLPGHGIDAEAHAAARPQDYADTVAEALAVMPALGERTVLVGSSTGGLIATWAAAEYPERVDALVLTSPFYALHSPVDMFMLRARGGPPLIRLLYGEDRFAGWAEDPEGRVVEGYDDHWLIDQKYAALFQLEALRHEIARPELFARVTAPVLVLAWFRDDEHQDSVVSVEAMRSAFAEMNGGNPQPASRFVPIEDGNHILTSAYVRTDKDSILAAMRSFLTETVGAP